MTNRHSGFTLVEAIIVVIIIGVLAAIAIPNYQSYITRSWETRAKTALQENMLFMEKMNARFYGYTQTRDRDSRVAKKIVTANLPAQALCTGGDCGRNYTFEVSVPNDDLSQYILVAYPTGSQAKSSKCGAFIINASGGQYAKYSSNGVYSPSFPTVAKDYSDAAKVKAVFPGTDMSQDCFD